MAKLELNSSDWRTSPSSKFNNHGNM